MYASDRQELADFIASGQARLLRQATGRTAVAAARELGVDYRTLLCWERGAKRPHPRNGGRYLAYLRGLRSQHGIVEIAGIRESVDDHGNVADAAGKDSAGQDLDGAAAEPRVDGARAGNARPQGAGCQDGAGHAPGRTAMAPGIHRVGQE